MPAARASKNSTSSTESTAKKAPAKKAAAKKASTRKATAKKATAKKATAKKATAKKATAKKATAKKATAEKATAKKTPAEKTPTKQTKKSVDTKPTKKKLPKFLTDKDWLESQRQLLWIERGKYTHNAELLAAEAHSLMADRDPGDVQFDEESGEGDTLAVERDRDLALSAQALEKVEEIDAAFGRLDDGSYGICVVSGEIIPKERLEAMPMASKTVAAQTAIF